MPNKFTNFFNKIFCCFDKTNKDNFQTFGFSNLSNPKSAKVEDDEPETTYPNDISKKSSENSIEERKALSEIIDNTFIKRAKEKLRQEERHPLTTISHPQNVNCVIPTHVTEQKLLN